MIPKSDNFNVLFCQFCRTYFVFLDFFGQTIVKAVEFDSEFCLHAIKIECVIPLGMLSAEFEARELTTTQSPPQLLFLLGLIAAQATCIFLRTHNVRRMGAAVKKAS
jgi:hypothetical protein